MLQLHKCDGKDDCGDNSDEYNCQTADYCDTEAGWFRCKNGVCVNSSLVCNGENDCGDFSDETSCFVNECLARPSPCPQVCIDKPVGYECACRPGFVLSPTNRHQCRDVDECLERPCSQLCKNTHGSYRCYCHADYVAAGTSCKAVTSFKPTLLLANR